MTDPGSNYDPRMDTISTVFKYSVGAAALISVVFFRGISGLLWIAPSLYLWFAVVWRNSPKRKLILLGAGLLSAVLLFFWVILEKTLHTGNQRPQGLFILSWTIFVISLDVLCYHSWKWIALARQNYKTRKATIKQSDIPSQYPTQRRSQNLNMTSTTQSAGQRLAEAKSLFEAGHISEQELKEKRAEILSNL